MRLARGIAAAQSALDAVVEAGRWLAIPLAVLLFAQWPLREVAQAGSREANDAAQILFAVYVALAVQFATRRQEHPAVDAVARRWPPRVRSTLLRFASLAFLVPWAAFMLWSLAPALVQSVAQLERFPETLNPGYFAVKLAAALFALLVLVQALLDTLAPPDRPQ